MDHQTVARLGLGCLCALQGLATIVIDLGRTHAQHPGWLGHARFHVAWQTASTSILAALEILLVFYPGPLADQRFLAAALLAGVPMLAFFLALAGKRLYGGTLSDPGGMPPVILHRRGSNVRIDMNLVAEIVGLLALAGCLLLYRR